MLFFLQIISCLQRGVNRNLKLLIVNTGFFLFFLLYLTESSKQQRENNRNQPNSPFAHIQELKNGKYLHPKMERNNNYNWENPRQSINIFTIHGKPPLTHNQLIFSLSIKTIYKYCSILKMGLCVSVFMCVYIERGREGRKYEIPAISWPS